MPPARWRFALLLVIALFAHAAVAAREIRVEPHFMFYFGYGFYLDYLHESPEDAFAYLKTFYDFCRNGTCYSNKNLRPQPPDQPFGFRFNGIPYWWIWDKFSCWSGGCNEYIGYGGGITAYILCPQEPLRFGAKQILTDPIDREVVCVGYLPDPEPCYDDCEARGNPIHPGTGQKLLVETDYSGPLPGLEFQRVYRSSNGYFASPVTAGWVDQSLAHAESGGCYPGLYFFHNRPYAHCYPYIGSGTQGYRLATADGHSLDFSGPANAITAKADVAERVTRRNGADGAIEWEIRRKDNSVEIYDGRGLLIRRTLVGGRTLHYTYSDATTPATVAPRPGLLIRMADRFGHALDFAYDAGARLVRMADPAGGLYDYAYDSAGNLAAVTYPDGRSRRYHYNEAALINGGAACSGRPNGLPRALTGVTDENDSRYATYRYDCDGRAVSSEHAGGVENYRFTYASPYPANFSTTETDPLGTTRTHTYTTTLGIARRTATTQPAPSGSGTVTASLSYDAHGNVISRTDFNGHRTIYAYDLDRNLEISRTEAGGTPEARTITTEWHPQFRLPTRIAEPGRATTFGYDDRGNPVSQTVTDTATGASRTWNWTYDADGQVLTEDGPRSDVNDVTSYTYYPDTTATHTQGDLATVTNALGHVTTYARYDAHGHPLTVVGPNGLATQLTYDPRGRITSRTVGGEVTTSAYDGVGQLTQVSWPDGQVLTYTYDAAHRLTDMTDQLGNAIHYTLDSMGNRIREAVHDPQGVLTQTRARVYDRLNRLSQGLGALPGETTSYYTYDPNGNLTTTTDPLNHVTTHAYDALDRLKQVTDPAGGLARYRYDGLDQITQVTDPNGHTTGYTVDGLGQRTQILSPDTGLTILTYDAVGNGRSSTDARGKRTATSYDALNRVIEIQYGDGSTVESQVSFHYDQGPNGLGRLTEMTDPSGSTHWSYDAHGRVLTQTQTVGSLTQSLSYAYDATTGQIQSLTYPSGAVISYGYRQGQLASLALTLPGQSTQTLLSNLHAQPFGPVQGWTWGNATPYVRSFDRDGRLTSYPLGTDTRSLTYDLAGRIAAITDSAGTQPFDYDAPDRLASDGFTQTPTSYTYDPNGNRLTQQLGDIVFHYTTDPASNRLTDVSGLTSYSYDATGNRIRSGGSTSSYDARGRLTEVTTGSGTVTYLINGLGQRVQKTGSFAPTGSLAFVYDAVGHLLGEYDAANQVLAETVYLGDLPVAVLRDNAIHYVYPDQLATPRLITDTLDAVRWRWDSDAFGNGTPNQNPIGTSSVFTYNLRFPGQYFDAETGLHYNGLRYYDPKIGRYLSSDPIGFLGGLNTYVYVDSNPLVAVDPLGLAKCTYSISSHTLGCTPNAGGAASTLGPSGVFSGLGPCKNKSSCANDKNLGPIQPGDYKINRDDRPGNERHWRLEPVPKVSGWKCYFGFARCGFKLHPGTLSLGCITADPNDPDAMKQYDQIHNLLQSEDGSNSLTVSP